MKMIIIIKLKLVIMTNILTMTAAPFDKEVKLALLTIAFGTMLVSVPLI